MSQSPSYRKSILDLLAKAVENQLPFLDFFISEQEYCLRLIKVIGRAQLEYNIAHSNDALILFHAHQALISRYYSASRGDLKYKIASIEVCTKLAVQLKLSFDPRTYLSDFKNFADDSRTLACYKRAAELGCSLSGG